MGVWKGPMGSPVKFIGQDDYEYTDKATASQYASSGTDWEIAFKASGTLKFKKNPGPIDVFLVGAGGDGDDGSLYEYGGAYSAKGGKGGDGGELVTQTNVTTVKRGRNYPAQVAANADTTIFGFTASAHSGNEGGAGSMTGLVSGGSDAGNGTAGSYAFGASTSLINSGVKYGASGGGGGSRRKTDWAGRSYGYGATTGSGHGGEAHDYDYSTPGAADDGADATANTGAGGGGGASVIDGSKNITKGDGGAGASGIIIIRNHRE